MPTATEISEVQSNLMTAARRLSAQPELLEALIVFRNYWGLDAYTPPEEVRSAVTNIVEGMIASANVLKDT